MAVNAFAVNAAARCVRTEHEMKMKTKCPLVPPARRSGCPPAASDSRQRQHQNEQPALVITRTERRSWVALAITGFGALLLRYFRTVRERGQTVRKGKQLKER